MKKIIIVTILYLVTLNINAQEYRKYWKDGELTWEDFKGKHTAKHTAYLSYMVTYKMDKKEINDVIYQGLFSNAYIDKSLSFFHPNLKNNNFLEYNQVLFNLIEISKRNLQQRLFELNNVYDANSLLMDNIKHLEKTIFDFKEEGGYGLQNNITKQWLTNTQEQLSKIPAFEPPNYKKSKWTYGMYGGLDFGMYEEDFSKFFKNTLALSFGFEFSYQKTHLLLNMSFTNSKLNKDFSTNSFLIPQGEKSTISMLNAAVGYPIYETNKLKIVPFIGYGLTALEEVTENKNKGGITKSTSIFGINFDFKNKKRINFTPIFFNIREEGNSFIRTRIFMAKSNFDPNLIGYSINIGVAYGFEARILSKK
ncbi:hypothetical protein MHL31_09335 [Lutibacter sp. A80]|uniref:hypothetical protein n=1 Tax=Lutibacter sp. A80 TaxID=2918453 RepID=UPI001F059C81|nr:hypothetical protein [Lutibacter sp. A80]UMB59282.1 hypothetical protein MHL31_09335 [Lutibacter sp. A80]